VGKRLRRLLGNVSLLTASAMLTWLAVELWLFPRFVRRVPLALHERIVNQGVRTLAQSSRSGPLPRDYVALVGDSYAAGEGDWRLSVDAGGNPPHHSGHLIHRASGRDVLSFGHAGAGSLRGLVSEPIGQVDYLRRTLCFAIEDPAEILVYFYEGNDLDDNVADLARRYDPVFERADLYDPATFRRFLDEVVLATSELARKAEGFRFHDNFFVARSLRWAWDGYLETGALRDVEPARGPPLEAVPGRSEGERTLRVGGEWVKAPVTLQGPSPELDEEEIRAGFYVFEQSLRRLADRFPEAVLRVLYVPSPLGSYELPEGPVRVQEDHHRDDRSAHFPGSFLRERSDALCAELARISARHGRPFRDARPGIRRAGARELLHGPRDWKHFNRAGQEALAREALALLDAAEPGGGCGSG